MSLLLLLLSICLSITGHPDGSLLDTRDAQQYPTVKLDALEWMAENLRYDAPSTTDTLIAESCGRFYAVDLAQHVCPIGWRLPTEKEVRQLIKADNKGKLQLADTLAINLCGRIDNGKHTKIGLQNTYWLQAPLEEGHITHWHVFGTTHKIHSHNVVVAERKFPVRCVRAIE